MKDYIKDTIGFLGFFLLVFLIVLLGAVMCSVRVDAQDKVIHVDPWKGQNSAFARDHVDASELILAENFWFNVIGDITKRPGFGVFNSATNGLDTFNVTGVVGGRLLSKDFFLVVTGDSLMPDSQALGRLAFAISANKDYDSTVMQYLPPDNLYDWTILKDTLFGVSGGAPTFVYTDGHGGNWLEIPPPGAPIAVPIGDIGSGSVSGVYQYAVFGFDADVMGPPSIPIRAQGQDVFLYGLQHGFDRGVDSSAQRSIYRRDINNSDTSNMAWFRIGVISDADSSVEIFIDNVVDHSDSSQPSAVHKMWANNLGITTNEDNKVGIGFPLQFKTVSTIENLVHIAKGTYAYGISYFNNTGDTTSIVTVGTILQSNSSGEFDVKLGVWPFAPDGINADSMILWRTQVGGLTSPYSSSDTTFYEAMKRSASFDALFLDTLTDALLVLNPVYSGGNTYGATISDSIPPDIQVFDIYRTPQGHQIEEHHRQLWIAPYTDMNSVEFSEVQILDSFPVSNKLSFPSTDGDSVVAMKSIGDAMVVWLSRSIWIVTGVDRFDVRKVKATAPIGCIAANSVDLWQNTAFFLSHDGVYTYSPGSALKPISLKINDIFDSLSLSERERAHGIVTEDGKYFLSFDGVTLVYDTRIEGWSRMTFGASGFAYSQLSGTRELLFGSPTGDSVLVFGRGDSTFTDPSGAFLATLRLPYIGPSGNQWQVKEVRIDRSGSGNGLVLRFYDENETLLDTMILASANGFQSVAPSASVYGYAISMELTDNKANDSLTIRSIDLIPRDIGREPLQ